MKLELIKRNRIWLPVLAGCLLTLSPASGATKDKKASTSDGVVNLEEFVVTGDLRDTTLVNAGSSIMLMDQKELQSSGARHFQDVIAMVPDLTWTGGTSRPRYLQIRGIGERSQYAEEGPPNFSVGFVIDDIDFSGLGMIASTFDVKQIEVFRGPQATIYGSSSMAGLVSIHTNDPQPTFGGELSLSAGSDEFRSAALAATGPVFKNDPKKLTWRLAVSHDSSDGFRNNVFLHNDDTNKKDEWIIRGKLLWKPSEVQHWKLTVVRGDLNNGDDEWSPDNGWNTYSDQPGTDTLRTWAGSLRGSLTGWDKANLLSITSLSNTNLNYSYDSDWGNPAYWAAPPYNWNAAVNGPYQYFEQLLRHRRTFTQEVRVLSKSQGTHPGSPASWVAGVYWRNLKESDNYHGFGVFQSHYQARNLAGYGQYKLPVSDRASFSISLRAENQWTDYSDNNDLRFHPSETMYGGRAMLEYAVSPLVNVYGSVSRGFKAGGFNETPGLPANRRRYNAEYVWNFETGARGSYLGGKLAANVTFYYMLRRNEQINSSFQNNPSDPSSFQYYITNAAQGTNYGLETELNWRPVRGWDFFGNLGLLHAKFDKYVSAGGTIALQGRDQPFSPHYTYSTGFEYKDPTGLFFRAEITGKDRYYFGNSDNTRSWAYNLVNLRAGYEHDTWTITVWCRNVLNRDYPTEAFYFGLEPPDFANKFYYDHGAPRQWGVTLDRKF